MKCPACGKGLTELEVAGIKVDICQAGCHGIWLDNYEIEKVDEAHESTGEKLLDFTHTSRPPADRSAKRACPKCQTTVMQRFYFSVKKDVEMDDCPNCGGTWLDANELAGIRSEYKTEGEKKQAAGQAFAKMFNGELAAQAARSQEELKRAQRFARAFKYVLPSYWIPGKQAGGAY